MSRIGFLRRGFSLVMSWVYPYPVLSVVQDSKMYLDLSDPYIEIGLYLNGVYESSITNFLKAHLKSNMVFVDVGAHIGYYSLLASKLVGSGGAVYAFEPTPTIFERLSKNVTENNYQNIYLCNKAVWDKTGYLAFAISKDNPANNRIELNDTARGLMVKSTTLDDLFLHNNPRLPDVIKIDAEGSELRILRGAEQTIGNHSSINIILEFSPYNLSKIDTRPEDLLDEIEKLELSLNILGSSGIIPTEKKQLLKLRGKYEFATLLLKKWRY